MFHDYLRNRGAKNARRSLIDLFRILDQKIEERDEYLYQDDPELAAFPYVNGSLFSDENIEIPPFSDDIFELLLTKVSEDFNWSLISPTIFGAVFESTLNPETRRTGGMHYTSIENIHKVIDSLFLNDLKAELAEIKNIAVERARKQRLVAFQIKLAGLKFLDPACGSGNFLTETYLSLRRLENETVRGLIAAERGIETGQIVIGMEGDLNPIQVSIGQLYGIEINDFAVSVAKTALWIAESQMMKQTEDIVHMNLDFLPLRSYASIVEGNALCIDWETVVPKYELNFIMGNPPFIGARLMSKTQKQDLANVFINLKNYGNLDYVSGWYEKAADIVKNTNIRAALVSTNSITQGEQAPVLWKRLFEKEIQILFAYRTFRWDSEATMKAHVHCVIIGFAALNCKTIKTLFTTDRYQIVKHINAYLVDGPDILISSRNKPICPAQPVIFGSMPNDGGYLSDYSEEMKNEIVAEYPSTINMFRPFIGATEFLHNKVRWCLWLKDVSPAEVKKVQPVMDAVVAVKKMRESSDREAIRKLAQTPYLFGEIRQPTTEYIIIPRHSTENRLYIPMGFVTPEIICGDSNLLIPDATRYQFGILMSNVHNSWMRAICGRIKSDYRYSVNIVYNNFPWPESTDAQQKRIEQTAQAILNARALYPDCSLADLYDELTMPPELRKAHQQNDRAVMEAYGIPIRGTTETSCVAELMKRYQALTALENAT
jgi:hypothetical protein